MEDTTERFIRLKRDDAFAPKGYFVNFVDPYYNPNLSYLEYYKINHAGVRGKQQLIALREYSASKK